MDQRQRTNRFCTYVILLACVIRLMTGLLPKTVPQYRETGHFVRFSSSSGELPRHEWESAAPWMPEPPLPVFGEEEAAAIRITNFTHLEPDLEELLQRPLNWDLTGGQPKVLILHTHATESYTAGEEPYEASGLYRTLEADHNMVSIGAAAAALLQAEGIGVIHDRQLHDDPSYQGSYNNARRAIQSALKQAPSIALVLDLHRDASSSDTRQLRTEAVVDGRRAAQLMLVVGTDASGLDHPGWEDNLALALKLQAQLERLCPGIMRPLQLRRQRFNQDLLPGALLVEVGAAGNTRQEALAAVAVLVQAIDALGRGVSAGDG